MNAQTAADLNLYLARTAKVAHRGFADDELTPEECAGVIAWFDRHPVHEWTNKDAAAELHELGVWIDVIVDEEYVTLTWDRNKAVCQARRAAAERKAAEAEAERAAERARYADIDPMAIILGIA
jgi:hypothetical protein